MGMSLKPAKSSRPILSFDYELSPELINMVQDQPFSSDVSENPCSHLCDFEQTCACRHIEGMSDKTLRWKLFPFSLTGEAKRWYKLHIGSSHEDWEALHSSFCFQLSPIYKVIKLHLKF
jgi:hypothetical protein